MKKIALFISAIVLSLNLACNKVQTVGPGKNVKMNYTLTVDGKVVDTSTGKGPLAFNFGTGQIIPGLEESILGLKTGDKKQVAVVPAKGYGELNPEARKVYPRASFKDVPNLKVGTMVTGSANGRPVQAKVLKITAKEVTLDFNHPLAGKTLNFDVEIVEITKAAKAT